jgi:hypothetical protein
MAMGRTGILSAADAACIFYNPALLGQIRARQFRCSTRGLVGDEDIDTEAEWDSAVKSYPLHILLSQLAIAQPLRKTDLGVRMTLGLGYGTYFDWASKGETDAANGTDRNVSHGGLRVLSLAASVIAVENVLLLGASVHHGVGGTLKEEHYENGERTFESESEHSASFLHLGIVFRPRSNVSIGILYRPVFDWEIENKRYRHLWGDRWSPWQEGHGRTVPIPDMLGIAVSYRYHAGVVLVGEYQSREYTRAHTQDPWGLLHERGGCYRIGIEVNPGVALRAGVFHDAVLAMGYEHLEMARMNGFGLGIGHSHRRLLFDFALELGFTTSDCRRDSPWHPDYRISCDRHTTQFKAALGVGVDF